MVLFFLLGEGNGAAGQVLALLPAPGMHRLDHAHAVSFTGVHLAEQQQQEQGRVQVGVRGREVGIQAVEMRLRDLACIAHV